MENNEVTKSLLETTKGVFTVEYAQEMVESAYNLGRRTAKKENRITNILAGLLITGVAGGVLGVLHLRGWRFSLKAKKGSTEHEFTTEKETNE